MCPIEKIKQDLIKEELMKKDKITKQLIAEAEYSHLIECQRLYRNLKIE
jgi:hypothetical protein